MTMKTLYEQNVEAGARVILRKALAEKNVAILGGMGLEEMGSWAAEVGADVQSWAWGWAEVGERKEGLTCRQRGMMREQASLAVAVFDKWNSWVEMKRNRPRRPCP